MRIVTYMGFTLLSILIQFCVMDFIQEKIQKDGEMLDLNETKSHENNYVSSISVRDSKEVRKIRNLNIELKKNVYSNITKLLQSGLGTEMTSTILDIFYEDNTSTTDFSFTTEMFSSTEVDNVTEINFPIDVKPPSKPVKPKSIIKDCKCDFMYEICDINCCCDSDCTDEEKPLFPCNKDNNKTTRESDGVCYAYLFHNDENYQKGFIDNMLCIVKVNLPEKRKFTHKYKESLPQHHYKWRSHNNLLSEIKFPKEVYGIGDPIWLLRNRSISHIDLPCPLINDYCSKRKPMGFLRDEEIKCIVKLKDLEMFHIYNLAEQTKIISVKNVSTNSSLLNCSTLYCANWTILVCDEMTCETFNKSIHEPTCSENICTNIASTLDYIFYAHETELINVTVKFHVQKISMDVPSYLMQKIRVKFVLSNKSIDEIVKYSGNPGYQHGLKVIFSRAQGNYTRNFLNSKIDSEKYFALPIIKNKQCFFPNLTDNFIVFGSNKRIKCKYVHENRSGQINKEVCNEIQVNIQKLLSLNKTMAVAPYGNPQHVSDEEWIVLNVDNSQKESVYGVYESFKIFCCNLITRISLSFAYTYSDEKGNKILSVKQQVMVSNKSFTIQDMSTVITIDISFIDVTKPAVFEYAGSPHIDINLPKDFFFPSNKSDLDRSNLYIVLFYCCISIIFK